MSTTTKTLPATCFEIRPPFLFRWEDSQQAHVLLYPEGIVKLNATGGEILQRCNGKTSVAELIDQLARSYNASNIDAIRSGILNFLEVSHGKGWIRAEA
ncbi:pyrroloquinoline quinone biosynthesis peptide chaperone PqqD [Stutzerimonas stutzeri]|uniref:Pyrroloquinoline quinone biosynthesis peptide chaperone PqqD n=1 Tax=Stutzerimonas stutzeri TaxID=316 RepID=A0A2N8RI89_STUST|nr:pyrroloquinoline quinone biosynthesis peptide chaperone PqqD [Stutzerimonas stutzeri]MCQ4252991.1 pyrroloquinoline quinone biosynthesis peptide chaperone PqqD [Stutzerimonas stutzeri]PNF60778.1 pyrroloquinoline quinone biosynthesis peptide chaperone PqqD [Stutzerimonas stutzeri]